VTPDHEAQVKAYLRGAHHCCGVLCGELRRRAEQIMTSPQLADLPEEGKEVTRQIILACASHLQGAFDATIPDLEKLLRQLADMGYSPADGSVALDTWAKA
jgi:hypothetical protein